ncbi:tetratricopeptide repeat protein [Arenimonas alkanexedens]
MKFAGLMVLALFLAGCGNSGGNAATTAPSRAKAKLDLVALVASVREVGVQGVELEVQPLRDPQVDDLRQQAETQEAAGDLTDAVATLDQALALVPGDPDLLQWKAELALLRRAWVEAERLANQSYESGPRLGGLCRRNWTTIQHARRLGGDADGSEVARRQVDACTVAPPVRM